MWSGEDRRFDVLILGGTGATGSQVVEQALRQLGSTTRIAVAGRCSELATGRAEVHPPARLPGHQAVQQQPPAAR